MTIFHKSMLAGAVEIARVEDDPTLNVVYLEPDGSVAAANQYAIYAASPAMPEIIRALPFVDVDRRLASPVAVPIQQLLDFIKSIPTDKQFKGKLEYISVVTAGVGASGHAGGLSAAGGVGGAAAVTATVHDGRAPRSVTLRGVRAHQGVVTWRTRLRACFMPVSSTSGTSGGAGRTAGGLARFVYNRERLTAVVAAFSAACKYDGAFSFIEQVPFYNLGESGGYIWRTMNQLTGQQVMTAWKLATVSSGEFPPVEKWLSGAGASVSTRPTLYRPRPR